VVVQELQQIIRHLNQVDLVVVQVVEIRTQVFLVLEQQDKAETAAQVTQQSHQELAVAAVVLE
jgi:hypothetical protein